MPDRVMVYMSGPLMPRNAPCLFSVHFMILLSSIFAAAKKSQILDRFDSSSCPDLDMTKSDHTLIPVI